MKDKIWKIAEDKKWDTLMKRFDWVADMAHVPQHILHHAEGDVGVHTQMVLNELQQSQAFRALDLQTQEILWAAALLHDVEKRSSSQDEGNGIITAHGHARKGEFTARSVLYKDIPTPFRIREQVASLVRYHGLPVWALERPHPLRKVAEASLAVSTAWLRLLAGADARGRICGDKDRLLDNLELFEWFCKEQDCWDKPKAFATDSARFHYFHTENSYVDYVPFDTFTCEVILLSGLPGMGKDHYIRSLPAELPVVSPDALRRKHKVSPTDKSGNGRIIQLAKEEARQRLRKKEDFIWNATDITSLMRSQLVDLFTAYNARVKIVYIEKPYATWRRQNLDREYPVPEVVLDRMLGILEVPRLTEAHAVEYMVTDGY